MNTVRQIGLGLGALGFIGMGTGIGLVLGGITETCCIGALTVSIPGFLYLVSAGAATAALLTAVIGGWLKDYENNKQDKAQLVALYGHSLGIIAINLGAYALAQYCYVGLAEQALMAAVVSGIGCAMMSAASDYKNISKERETQREKAFYVGAYIRYIGFNLLIGSLATGVAVAASAALPLVLTVNMPAEMLIAAQWLTAISVRDLIGEVLSSIGMYCIKRQIAGFNDISMQKLGALVIGGAEPVTGAEYGV